MDKFEKKIRKLVSIPENALVVGSGIGNLSSIINMHDSVFIVDCDNQIIKSKKLIYREDINNLKEISNIRVIYVDIDKLHRLEVLKNQWQRHKSLVIVEGGEPIGRDVSNPLYNTSWGCVSVEKRFHVWERLK
jgi:hypothetical protein